MSNRRLIIGSLSVSQSSLGEARTGAEVTEAIEVPEATLKKYCDEVLDAGRVGENSPTVVGAQENKTSNREAGILIAVVEKRPSMIASSRAVSPGPPHERDV